MDLKQNSSTDWCEDDFDEDDINRPGPSGLKDNTGHFLIGGLKFKNIDFIKDTFTDDNLVLTDNNGRPYDVLTNSDMQSMTVLDNQTTGFGITKHSETVMLPEYNNISEVATMVSMPEQYFQSDLYHIKSNSMSQVPNTHSVMENLSHNNSLSQIDQMSFISKPSDNFVNNLGSNEDMILETGNNRFLFSENGNSYIEVTLKEGSVLSGDENGFYVVPRPRSVQENHIGQKIVTMDDLSLLASPKSHHNVKLLVNHEELVDDIDTCDIAVVDESQIPLNSSQLKDRIDEGSQSVSLDVDHQQHSSGFQRMSKETIEMIAEEFVRQPQCIDEDININFINRINSKSSVQIEYWCEDCNKLYQSESNCPIHQVSSIIDLAVQTRARASLPVTHLRIMKIEAEKHLNKFGVFARKTIQKRTQFGPLEGIIVKDEECVEEELIIDEIKYLLEIENKEFRRIDVSNEDNANWMCFVRPAKTKQAQNMIVDQIGDYLFFTTTRTIFQREELLVGYSTFYAHKRGLNLLPTANSHQISSHIRKSFKSLKTSQEFNKQSEISKNNLTNRGNNMKKTSLTAFKHIAKKRKLPPNRLSKNNAQSNVCVSGKHNSSRNAFRTKYKTNNCKKNVWMCAACDLKFTKRELVIIHNKTHEDEFDVERTTLTSTICPECNTDFRQIEELTKHVSVHSLADNGGFPTIYNCYRCDRRYRNTVHLKAHQAKHKADELKPFKCNMCDKRFLNTVTLTCHVRTHFEGVIYDCPICRLTFVDLKSLKTHVYSHAVDDIFYCPMCPGVQFKTYKLIRKHIRARHNGVKFRCEYCSRLLNSRFSLALHMLSHTDQKDFLCTMCGKQFKRKDKLKMHMNKIHFTKKKPTKAEKELEARAAKQAKQIKLKSSKSVLEYENSQYRCDRCVVGFKKRGVFVNHLVSRHPEISLDSVPSLNQPIVVKTKMYMCLYCDKVYKTNAKRKSHIIKNHPDCSLPEKPTDKTVIIDSDPSNQMAVGAMSQVHSCQWCYKQYVLKDKLLKHQRANHYHLLPSFLQVPKPSKKLGHKSTKPIDQSATASKSEQLTQTVNLQFTDTDGFELTATDIQLDNPIEPGSIIAIKRPAKDNSELVSQAMRDLGIIGDTGGEEDDEVEEQYYRILETQGDVAYAQAIDPPVTLLSFDGHTVQQVLSSCGDTVPAVVTTSQSDSQLSHHHHQHHHHLHHHNQTLSLSASPTDPQISLPSTSQ